MLQTNASLRPVTQGVTAVYLVLTSVRTAFWMSR